jgi:hypothetical protein
MITVIAPTISRLCFSIVYALTLAVQRNRTEYNKVITGEKRREFLVSETERRKKGRREQEDIGIDMYLKILLILDKVVY